MKKIKKDLSVGYYKSNFLTLLTFVEKLYRDLLTPEELKFIKDFKKLSEDAARLFVRLISRRGPRFRMDKLNYPEIKNIEAAAKELQKKGFFLINPIEEKEYSLDLLTKPELVSLARVTNDTPKGFQSLSRPEIFESLLDWGEDSWWDELSKEFTVFEPLHVESFEIVRLLFFGNLEQDLSQFILEDLGIMRFEPYKVTKGDRFFKSREMLEQTLSHIEWNGELFVANWEEDEEQILLCLKELDKLKIDSLNLKKRLDKSYNNGARVLEKLQNYKAALKYYKKSELPPARERRVRVLIKMDEPKKAWKLFSEIEKDIQDASEEEFLEVMRPKLLKLLERSYEKRKLKKYNVENIKIPKGIERVEELVVKFYEEKGQKGFHLENSLWTALFGLVFWKEIFGKHPGVFFHPYQRGPKDIFTEDFYKLRKVKLDKQLKNFKESEILKTYKEKELMANHFVNWKKFKFSHLERVLKLIPRKDIQSILGHMLKNPGKHCAGFPDLFVYTPRKKDYLLVEVKSPNDQLQPSQKRWIKVFEEKSIPYQIAKVEWKST